MILLIMFAYFCPPVRRIHLMYYIESLHIDDSVTRSTPNLQCLITKPAAVGMWNLCVILALEQSVQFINLSLKCVGFRITMGRDCIHQGWVQTDPPGNNRGLVVREDSRIYIVPVCAGHHSEGRGLTEPSSPKQTCTRLSGQDWLHTFSSEMLWSF